MFSDTLRPVLFCPPSIDGFSSSVCGKMYPHGASTGTSTSTDDASTIEATSPSASVSALASDIRREHMAITERKVDMEGNENNDMDGCFSKDKEGKKEKDSDRRGDRGMDRDNAKNRGMGMNKETVVSRLYCTDNASGWNVRSSPRMKSESVDTYQVPALQANWYLKAGSSSDDCTDMTHMSVDNNDGSESVSFRMEQLIQEAGLLQVIDTETAQERQRRIISLVTLPKAPRLPEMVGKYGTPLEPVAVAEPSYSATLATCKPSNVLTSLDGAKRRVSFCTANADCAGVTRTLYKDKDDSETRTQDRMLAKLLQNKEVEIGSIKQLMGLGNFQAQLMGSRSGVRSMRKRLEEEIVQQRAPYEENDGGAISQSTRTRRAMSALTYLRSSSHKHFASPRRHSTNSGLLTLDQQMQLGDMMLKIAETAAPDIPFCNPIFDPSRYAASSFASSIACTVEAPTGEVGGSALRVGETPDPTAASLPADGTSRASGNGTVARKKVPKSNSNSNGGSSLPSGTASKSKATTRPVSRKFKLIRELADFARRQSEESILANEEDPDQSVASMDHLHTLTVPGGVHFSSLKRHSSASLTTSTPSSSIDSPSPSRGSTPHLPSPKGLDDKPMDCAERGASASERGEGQGEHILVAESHLAKENSKKYQFWLIVVQISSIKNLMSARVADQIEDARVCLRRGHVRAANRIGACYLRYFKIRMNRLMAVYRRDHKAARRPIRLMVRDLPCLSSCALLLYCNLLQYFCTHTLGYISPSYPTFYEHYSALVQLLLPFR